METFISQKQTLEWTRGITSEMHRHAPSLVDEEPRIEELEREVPNTHVVFDMDENGVRHDVQLGKDKKAF